MRKMIEMFVSTASCERLPMMLWEGGGSIVHPIQPWFKMFHLTSVQLGQMIFQLTVGIMVRPTWCGIEACLYLCDDSRNWAVLSITLTPSTSILGGQQLRISIGFVQGTFSSDIS